MVRELSLGERMKMELISALIHEPRVLFLDEPTIGLDVVSQKRVREFLRVYNREHRIVTMLTSHYMQDIQELCERVIVIDHGRIFFDGPLDAIIDRFSSAKVISLTFEEGTDCDFAQFGEVVEQIGLRAARNSEGDAIARMPYSPSMYQALAIALVRHILAARRTPAKVVAVDCDNTLWGGIIGESGLDGILLSPDGPGDVSAHPRLSCSKPGGAGPVTGQPAGRADARRQAPSPVPPAPELQ